MKAGRWSIYVGAMAIVQLLTACSDQPAGNHGTAQTAEIPNTTVPVADGKLVVAFGDSLYAGYGVAQNESFPFRLEQALKARGLAVQVHNAGVSGETSLGGMQRLAFTLDGLPRKPDLLLLDLGGNDMLRGLPPEESEKNLRAILDQLKQRHIPVLLTGMMAAPNMGKDYGAKFDAIYPRLAKDYDLPLYPFLLDGVIGDPKLMQADSIHPNPAGVTIIVGKIAPMIAGLLKDA